MIIDKFTQYIKYDTLIDGIRRTTYTSGNGYDLRVTEINKGRYFSVRVIDKTMTNTLGTLGYKTTSTHFENEQDLIDFMSEIFNRGESKCKLV